MVDHKKWELLQLFGEGDSGAPAADASQAPAGEAAADAGQNRLRELGVPEDKLHRHRSKPETKPVPESGTPEKTRMTWEEILADPEYNGQIQKIVRSRLRDQGQHKAILDTLSPALEHLARQHGMDPKHLDHTALVKAITGEYDAKARELGIPREIAMQLDQQQRQIRQQNFRSHMDGLLRQEAAFREILPEFDLRQELANPLFARLTAPGVGMSLEDAFYAVHRREMQQQTMLSAAQKTREMIANAIASGSARPVEAGATGQSPSVARFDYRNASREQRQALKDEIRRAAAEGRKLYPGEGF